MSIRLSDYQYDLPASRIAVHPLKERDEAKMLVYQKGEIRHQIFKELPEALPQNSLLVFNESRVVQARLLFKRKTGAQIEVFCLNPVEPYREMSQAMQVKGRTVWECMAGNQKRWKADEWLEMPLENGGLLKARLLEKRGRDVLVEFRWEPKEQSWAQILEIAGRVPLPPYIQREVEASDKEEYQTVYARAEGAVAAPTAGLHFTPQLLDAIRSSGAELENIVLHVGAGTFQPIEEEDVTRHIMHNEQILFSRKVIEKLRNTDRKVIAIGTTAMRALESLCVFGQMLSREPGLETFFVPKLWAYENADRSLPGRKTALQNILNWMEDKGIQSLWGQTEIFIMPGYAFRICEGLITNFHLSQSTLLLLIAAFIGEDWKRIYQEALENDYRFLSFGDGSLLLR
jgi:S-adenosylmethionine:tRNA ribosyltransferase-isomerase